MNFRGKQIDPIQLWGNYCEIKPEPGTFLSLTFCPNPNHLNSRSPAFQINQTKPFVHCFSYCGISGTYEHAIALIEGLYDKYKVTEEDLNNAKTKPHFGESPDIRSSRVRVHRARKEAKKIILRRSVSKFRAKNTISVDPNSRASAGVNKVQSKLKEDDLSNYTYLPKPALAYLEDRGINYDSRAKWQIGFDEDLDRLTIPVFDSRNRLKFIIKRAIYERDKPGYLYPDDSAKSSLLFGTCALDRSMVGSHGLILVEGSIDCICMHQHGHKNTVAILGNSLSFKQRKEIVRLNPKCIYLFLDKDDAGVRGMERAATMLESKYSIKVLLYPKGENLDPAKLTPKQIENALRKAIPFLRMKKKLKEARKRLLV